MADQPKQINFTIVPDDKADPNTPDFTGRTAMAYARQAGRASNCTARRHLGRQVGAERGGRRGNGEDSVEKGIIDEVSEH